jgi:hypothetical protein
MDMALRLSRASQLLRCQDSSVLEMARSGLVSLSGRLLCLATSADGPSHSTEALLFHLRSFARDVEVLASSGRVPAVREVAEVARQSASLQASILELANASAGPTQATAKDGLAHSAGGYREAADASQATAKNYRLAGTAAWGVTFAVVAIGLVVSYLGEPQVGAITFFYQSLVAAAVSAVAAIWVMVLSERHRRLAEESRQLERQLALVDPYLETLPGGQQALMRATLAPRIFSRMSNDDELISSPLWPTAEEILRSGTADSSAGIKSTPRWRLFASRGNSV